MKTSLERLQEIEQERAATMSDSKFIEWMKEMKVSQQFKQPNFQAREMMGLWKDKNGISNSFIPVIARLK